MKNAQWSNRVKIHFYFKAAGCLLTAIFTFIASTAMASPQAIVKSEFLFQNPPFKSCHASTIEETKDGHLIAAWFGGSEEGALDVSIWTSRHNNGAWGPPVEVATGRDAKENRLYPTWNPVLFQPSSGPLLLFYKVGPNPREWWGMLMKSYDGGRSWESPIRLRKGIYGPIKNKPVELSGEVLLCGSSTEDRGWLVHMERGRMLGKFWGRTPPLHNAMEVAAIQPTILNWGGDKGIQILCRSKQREIVEFWSKDKEGEEWGRQHFTELPNPNSGIDSVMLQDGRALLVYNHTKTGRSPLNVALSENGEDWLASLVLENDEGEYSYPAVIQTTDGLVHITYTWRRDKIKHVVLDPKLLDERLMKEGVWR